MGDRIINFVFIPLNNEIIKAKHLLSVNGYDPRLYKLLIEDTFTNLVHKESGSFYRNDDNYKKIANEIMDMYETSILDSIEMSGVVINNCYYEDVIYSHLLIAHYEEPVI